MYRLILVVFMLFGVSMLAMAQEDCDGDPCTEVAVKPEYGLAAEIIEAYEAPEFEQLFVDQDLLHDRTYVQVTGAMNVYDAPGGNILRTLDAGFNFMTVMDRQGDWVMINPNEWVPASSLTYTNHVVSEFTGIFLPEEPLEYTPAWMLINAYPSKEPGGEPRESNGMHYRYTRVDIFASAEVDGWRWYQIGPDKWVHQTHVAKVQPLERPEEVTTERWVGIDLYEQVLIAYEGDTPIFATLVATGLPRWPTYEGTFNIYWRRVRDDMTWGTPGDDFYYLEDVPWTMYFDEGRALHGAYWHDGLGYRRSHGCVNLSITDAHWLYQWVAEDFEKLNSPEIEEGPAVHVYSSDTYIN
ncbi:MAG: hypothetical protein OHK0046_27090 [Anaerolineae bacterium]